MDMMAFKSKLRAAHKSVTNRLVVLGGMAAAGIEQAYINFPMLQGFLPEKPFHWAAGMIAAGVFIRRTFYTDTAIEKKP